MNSSVNMKFIFVLVLCSVLHTSPVMSLWEYAVTTKNKILFYDNKWSQITSAAHQFDELSAIAFDESEEKIYFSNQVKNNESIYSLKLSQDDDQNHMTGKILSRTQNETIDGMTFDPVDRVLYWTDKHNRRIYKIVVDDPKAQPQVVIDFSKGDEIPDGIAIDICRRKLYWTNSNHKNPTVEQSSLLGNSRKILVDSDIFLPHGIVVDQYSHRIYWVVDQEGRHFSVESSNFEGNDRRVIVKGLNNIPLNLAVTKDLIFWTDITYNAIWNISKNGGVNERPAKVQSYSETPKGIVTRMGLLSKLENNVDCTDQVKKIKSHLLSPKSLNNKTLDKATIKKRQEYCLNNGEYSAKSGLCVCKVGFTGAQCDIQDCHNYCVHGTCTLNSMGFAHCTCQEGFYGERCQSSQCTNYCLNGGQCIIRNEQPLCECLDNHSGIRCETNTTEICLIFCKYGRNITDWSAPPQCPDTCNEEAIANYKPQKLDSSQSATSTCSSSKYNLSLMITILGVIIALTLTLFIVKAIRRIYKPARPRIKKTFFVQKKISQTPLTSRPVATEQCEITIENCCNMNICDTPCFDPKLLQQNISCDNVKDDKKILINHMDDDLY